MSLAVALWRKSFSWSGDYINLWGHIKENLINQKVKHAALEKRRRLIKSQFGKLIWPTSFIFPSCYYISLYLTPVSVCSLSFNNTRLFWCTGSVWWWRWLWPVYHAHPPNRINFKPHPVMFLLLPWEAHGNYSNRPLQLFQSHGLSDNRSHHNANKGKVSGLRAMFYSLSFLPCALEKSNY